VMPATAPSARGGGSREHLESEDDRKHLESEDESGLEEEEDMGGGITGKQGTNKDDAGSESTPGKKRGRTMSQEAVAKARQQAEYNIERYGLKSARFAVCTDFLVYDQEKCKGVKQVEDMAVCKLCYNNSNDLHMCEIACGKSSSTRRRRHLEKHHQKEFLEQIKEVALSKVSAEGCSMRDSYLGIQDSRLRIQDSGFMKTGFRIQDSSGFMIHQDSGFRIKAIHCVKQSGVSGFRIQTERLRIRSEGLMMGYGRLISGCGCSPQPERGNLQEVRTLKEAHRPNPTPRSP